MVTELLPLLKVEAVEKKKNFSKFILEPLPTGFGHTLGNALRRVLLSSLRGAAVTQFKIEGIRHQFSTIPGMEEDVVELSLNIKKIRVKIFDENPVTLRLKAKGPKKVKAGDLEVLGNGEIVSKDLYLLTLASRSEIDLEMVAEPGVGYEPCEEREISKIGIIPVDSIFTPVTAIAYRVETTRLGRRTNLDRLILEITTDGTVEPKGALKQASDILVDYFKVVGRGKIKGAKKIEKREGAELKPSTEERETPIEDLGLSTRTANALLRGKIETLGDLVEVEMEKLGKIRGLGEKALSEIGKLLKKQGLKELV